MATNEMYCIVLSFCLIPPYSFDLFDFRALVLSNILNQRSPFDAGFNGYFAGETLRNPGISCSLETITILALTIQVLKLASALSISVCSRSSHLMNMFRPTS